MGIIKKCVIFVIRFKLYKRGIIGKPTFYLKRVSTK